MSDEHPCVTCGELTLNAQFCRECDLDRIIAGGSCRECLTFIVDPESPIVKRGAVKPIPEQHKPDCPLRDGSFRPRNEDELRDVLRRRMEAP